ncbi:MAG: agmatinase [Candidatus Thorarchaeota archaeon]
MVKLPENSSELLDLLTKKLNLNGQTSFGGFQNTVELSDYIIFGAPIDDTATYRAGCGEGPKFLREAAYNIETINIFNWRDLEEVKFHDAGDLNWPKTVETISKVKEIQEIIDAITNVGKKPIMLGGEHTIMVGSRNSFKDCFYIVFDAHSDLRNSYQNNPYSHACASRRLLDDGYLDPEQLFQIGIRALSPEEVKFIKEKKINQILAPKFTKDSVKEAIKKINDLASSYRGLYISVDTDGFDPSFAPGVGNPEPFGINPYDALTLLNQLEVPILGMDLNEFNPLQDSGGITSVLCAKLLFYVLTK